MFKKENIPIQVGVSVFMVEMFCCVLFILAAMKILTYLGYYLMLNLTESSKFVIICH